ncbi:transposase [Tepiditoga spiralis]|uniref:transposase n=1 Tax=Tepiditoga spiralis TaxID=2108365 RepID=UPI003B847563
MNILINKHGKKHIKHLYDFDKVSKSGYYNHFNYNISFKRHKGARQIKMTLKSFFDTIFNLKKIRRLMKKFGLFCPIRKKNESVKISVY